MVTTADVAIVGARIGGSVTAALLGEAGYRVLLIDATTFPSDTISNPLLPRRRLRVSPRAARTARRGPRPWPASPYAPVRLSPQ
ncbi:MAG: NAD(P)/FAD-dependent oxidoreductase [Chloroflexi bacterium]|nr:NAD(P)/FAD-dependent oxidoreductase [Chloroflexota bacterium]